jgi:hypothetical protein
MASPSQQTSCDRLSESQAQLNANVQQLRTENENLQKRYITAPESEQSNIKTQMNKNVALWTSLLRSAGTLAQVQTTCVANQTSKAETVTILGRLMEQQLKDAQDQLAELETSRADKERMIELNTYYGKRFMAQAGVMKIFIYMCIPVLILAILANMGFVPNYIAGFMIIASIVVGIVYIYSAVSDINRRDKMNFDEYTWEFDPSRVGSVINPNLNSSGGANASNFLGCYEGACCNPPSTIWDPNSKTCIVQNAQGGGGSGVTGTSSASTTVGASTVTTAPPYKGNLDPSS